MRRQGPSQELGLGTRQELQLLPRMLQSIEVLALPAGELESYLLEAAHENVGLSLEREPSPPPLPVARRREDSERFDAWLANQPDAPGGLVDELEGQLAMIELTSGLEPWVHLVIEALDPTGRLSLSDDALLALAVERGLSTDAGRLGRAIAVVQSLEPRGIGGRDLVETLLLQLDPADADYAVLCRLLEEFLDDLARNRLPSVARALGVDLEQLNDLVVRLGELDPVPCRIHSGQASPPIRPDVVVERAEVVGESSPGWTVRLERSGLPAVTIDARVEELARDAAQPADVRRYLRGRIERARWLVDAVEERGRTLLRVASALFEHQHAFLAGGPTHLVPLRMNRLAEELELHPSTISRAVAGKYAETPWGIHPLRHFFQSPGPGGPTTTRSRLAEEVRAVVGAEDPMAPLSDDEIVARLAERGVSVARRTVAKYRRELGLPSSYRRRRFTN